MTPCPVAAPAREGLRSGGAGAGVGVRPGPPPALHNPITAPRYAGTRRRRPAAAAAAAS